MGVDYGRARTGLALSDPVGVTCRPLGVLAERDRDKVIEAICSAAQEHSAEGIVVGLPRPLGGGTNAQVQDVLQLVSLLRERSQVPVSVWDERFTSTLARGHNQQNTSEDAIAACYMLQNYLDRMEMERRG